MFGAPLVGIDHGAPFSVLASVPELNSDTSRVFPDGRMETTYRLKPGLAWHDGTPLSAEDFVFTQRLNVERFQMGLSVSSITPAEHRVIAEASAPAIDTIALPSEPFSDALDRVLAKYPYDLRRTDELMLEAGFVKGSDGFYASSERGRFAPEVFGLSEGQDGEEATAVADYFKRAGIDARLRLVTAIQLQNSDEMKASFPAWRDAYGLSPNRLLGYNIATPENRWSGTNKYGYNNAAFDRLFDQRNQALERGQRNQLNVQLHKMLGDELPFLPLFYDLTVVAHAGELQDPQGPARETTYFRNLHEWRWNR